MKVLTANGLSDGEALFYSAKGWGREFQQSEVAENADEESRLATIGAMAYANNEVVDVNLIDVTRKDNKLHALRLRERIRAEGPSIEYIGKNAAWGI
ncbi:MAG: DUF2849 domain-containing protein [Rhizobiaceae bacterium]